MATAEDWAKALAENQRRDAERAARNAEALAALQQAEKEYGASGAADVLYGTSDKAALAREKLAAQRQRERAAEERARQMAEQERLKTIEQTTKTNEPIKKISGGGMTITGQISAKNLSEIQAERRIYIERLKGATSPEERAKAKVTYSYAVAGLKAQPGVAVSSNVLETLTARAEAGDVEARQALGGVGSVVSFGSLLTNPSKELTFPEPRLQKSYISENLMTPTQLFSYKQEQAQVFPEVYGKSFQEQYGGGVSPITPSDITTLAFGGVGLVKGGVVTAASILFSKLITKVTSKGIDFLIPRQDTGLSAVGILPQIGRGGLFLLSTPLTGTAYAAELGKGVLTSPSETYKGLKEFAVKNPYELTTIAAGGILTAKARTSASQVSLFGKKPYQLQPTLEMIKSVGPYSRQRATVILKDVKGKIILGKTKSGEYISIGGGIEKGQTARTAALAELRQETGLRLKDITGFKRARSVIFPEESFKIFTATVKSVKKIKPSSDITDIVRFNPKKALGITGQTSSFPIGRYFLKPIISPTGKLQFPIGRLRAYEYGILNYLQTGQKPTWLAADTKFGTYILGTQSRYNVPYSAQKQYLKQEELLLAHGTPSPEIIKRYTPFEKTTTIKGELTRRGQAEGLYVQPPISAKPGSQGYIGLSYVGFKTSQASESLGFRFQSPKSTAYLFKEKPSGAIVKTPKTLAGIESELLIIPSTKISTVGRADVFSIGFKRVYLQPTKIVQQGYGGGIGRTIADISSEQRYTYISPSQLFSLVGSSSKVSPSYSPSISLVSKSGLSTSKYQGKSVSKSYYKSISQTSQSVRSLSKSSVSYPYTSSTTSIVPTYTSPPQIRTNFILPTSRIKFGEKARRNIIIGKQPTRYQTSFTGSILKLRSSVPEDYEKFGYGALRVRGIIDTKLSKRLKRKRII